MIRKQNIHANNCAGADPSVWAETRQGHMFFPQTPSDTVKRFGGILGRILASILSFLVMIVLAIVSFYFTVFVVSAGASFAGYSPSADYAVL